jgi:hypothetical protein
MRLSSSISKATTLKGSSYSTSTPHAFMRLDSTTTDQEAVEYFVGPKVCRSALTVSDTTLK